MILRTWLQRAGFPRRFQSNINGRFLSQQTPQKSGHGPGPGSGRPAADHRLDKIREKLDWWIAKSPRAFRPTLRTIRDAPASYTVSFLILHELTALVPLAGLTAAFHYFRWLPAYFSEGEWAVKSVEKLGRYARKKGWIQESVEKQAGDEVKHDKARLVEKDDSEDSTPSRDRTGQREAVRWLIEVATAYTIVKALLPLRLLVSAWAAPVFARWTLIPLGNLVRGSRKSKSLR